MKKKPRLIAMAESSLRASAALPGAKAILSYEESAFQTLPLRLVTHDVTDVTTGNTMTRRVRLSDIIVAEAQNQGIDPLIIDIIIGHESGFATQATSAVGACGLMQLMPATAAELGVTDINDPAQNVAAGTRYFADQYRRYGNLQLALAAYNAGPGMVDSCGGVPDIAETVNYVSSISQEYETRHRRR